MLITWKGAQKACSSQRITKENQHRVWDSKSILAIAKDRAMKKNAKLPKYRTKSALCKFIRRHSNKATEETHPRAGKTPDREINKKPSIPEKKEQKYTTHSIALAGQAVDNTKYPFIDDYVQTYGLRSFAPENIERLRSQVPADDLCMALVYVLRQLVVAEHQVANIIRVQLEAKRDREGKREEQPEEYVNPWMKHREKKIVSITPLVASMLDTISKCKEISYAALSDIIGDLHPMDDRRLFFQTSDLLAEEARQKEFKYTPGALPQTTLQFPAKWQAIVSTHPAIRNAIHNKTIVVTLDSAYEYIGHIFVDQEWASDAFEIVGIRTSMVNLACRSTPNVAAKILLGVVNLAKKHGISTISVQAPLPKMQKLLKEKFRFPRPWRDSTEALWTKIQEMGEGGTLIDYGCDFPYQQLVEALQSSPEGRHDIESLAAEWRAYGATPANIQQYLMYLTRSGTKWQQPHRPGFTTFLKYSQRHAE